MTGSEKSEIAALQIEVAVMKRDMDDIKAKQDKILEHVERTDATINQAKGARWMLLTLVATIPASAVYALASIFKSGAPTH